MATANIIIVGGGLAGLMATIKAAESGAHVQLFSLVPVKITLRLCARRHQRRGKYERGGRLSLGALRRYRLRR